MKKLTKFGITPIILACVLVISVASLLGYLFVAPDFVAPDESGAVNDCNTPVWDAGYDDLIVYLQKKGFIGKKYDLISEGVATEARTYNNVEIYWWDVDNLAKDSDEYKAVIVQISKIAQLMVEAESRNFTILLKDYHEKIPVSRDKFQRIVDMLREISGITVTGSGKYE